MRRLKFLSGFLIMLSVVATLLLGGCFGTTGGGTATDSTTVVKPLPAVSSVVASTTGTADAYYAILDIKVKNSGAEGTILVVASVTQGDKTVQNEMPVFLMHNETHELKMTFPLVWKGGDFTSSVHTQIP
jgi:hypothetical protein